MNYRVWLIVLLVCGGCSDSAKTVATTAVVVEPPPDQSRHFAQAGLVKMERVAEHLLGKKFMPGGNLATYTRGKVPYQEFLAKMPDADHAAFLLLDWHKELRSAKYLAHMGGYFGMDGDRPVYVFAKGVWIVGVVGLMEGDADRVAREFALRI